MAYFAERYGETPLEIPDLVTDSSLRPRDLRALRTLVQVIRSARPHVVHTHTAKAGFVGRVAARLTRTPVVVHTYHGHVLHAYFPEWKNRILRRVEAGLGLLTDRLVAVSSRVRDDLLRHRVAGASKIEVVPLGLDLAPFARSAEHTGQLRQALDVAPDTFVMTIVGRITRIKNHALFLHAAARVVGTHPNTMALVVGDGELRRTMERLARDLGLASHVRFLGWRRDLPVIYADTNVLVVASDNEGTPVAAIEAMAAGCPVVATRVGGVPDLISHRETGTLVPPGDPDTLSRELLFAREHPAETRRWATLARERALDRHRVDVLVDRVDRLYQRLITAHRLGERTSS